MLKHHKKAVIILFLLATALAVLKTTDMGDTLTLTNIQQSALALKSQVDSHYLSSVLIFIAVYVVVNLWLPAAAVLTLLAGFLFGVLLATVYVVIAATLGALLGFWVSRHIVGKWLQRKWHDQLIGFNNQIDEHGYVYLVLIRMFPMMPYSLINFLAGLTKVPAHTVAWTSAAGSFPGIVVFSYAGRQLLTIKTVDDVLTGKVIAAFAVMMLFVVTVLVIRHILRKKKKAPFETTPEAA